MRRGLIKELKKGLRFKCELCGRCCRGLNEGYVFIYGDKILNIARSLDLDLSDFIRDYCEIIDAEYRIFTKSPIKPTKKKVYLKSIVLKQSEEDGSCIFLRADKKCKIYENRPIQCQTWPIWFDVMTNKNDFKEAKEKCPGFKNSDGNHAHLIEKRKILETIRDEILLEQDYIEKMRKNRNDLKLIYPFLKEVKQDLSKTTS